MPLETVRRDCIVEDAIEMKGRYDAGATFEVKLPTLARNNDKLVQTKQSRVS
jgi:hypothetical protein